MVTAGSLKKVQFYVALALVLGAMPAAAAELQLPLTEMQQQLSEKIDEAFSRKLEECREKAGEERSGPRYPVRIAGQEVLRFPTAPAGTQLASP